MKNPTLQQDMDEIPPPPSDKVIPMLPVDIPMPLDTPEVSIIEGFTDEPITPPRKRGYLVIVEWPIRPGDTRIEAYHIGTDQQRKYWYLWQFTMNDLVPFYPKYLEKRVIARMLRGTYNKRDAAVILLRTVWEWERDEWYLDRFFWVSDAGLLSTTEVNAVADLVWGKEG